MTWIADIVHGILLGGFYALLASGLALMFGVMRIINLAHGSLALLGAYMAFLLTEHLHISTYLALAPVLPGALVAGYVLQRTMLERSLRAGELVPHSDPIPPITTASKAYSSSFAPAFGSNPDRIP